MSDSSLTVHIPLNINNINLTSTDVAHHFKIIEKVEIYLAQVGGKCKLKRFQGQNEIRTK